MRFNGSLHAEFFFRECASKICFFLTILTFSFVYSSASDALSDKKTRVLEYAKFD